MNATHVKAKQQKNRVSRRAEATAKRKNKNTKEKTKFVENPNTIEHHPTRNSPNTKFKK